MARRRAGLQRNVPAIFDGVSVPGSKDQKQGQAVAERRPQEPDSAGASRVRGVPSQAEPKATTPSRAKVKAVDTGARTAAPVRTRAVVVPKSAGLVSKLRGLGAGSDPRQKKVAVLAGVLLVVFLVVVVRPLLSGSGGKNTSQTATQQTDEGDAPQAMRNVSVAWQRPDLLGELARDPMVLKEKVLVVDDSPQTATIVVSGIFYSEDRPSVVIGPKIMHEGDQIGGATIVKIDRKSVEFEMGGERWTQRTESPGSQGQEP